jgi:hypothetical protein
MSSKAQLKGLPVHLKQHDFDIKQVRKRDIKMGRQNITQTLQMQNRQQEATMARQKQNQLQHELSKPHMVQVKPQGW